MTKIDKKVSSFKKALIEIKTGVTKPRTEALFSPIIFGLQCNIIQNQN